MGRMPPLRPMHAERELPDVFSHSLDWLPTLKPARLNVRSRRNLTLERSEPGRSERAMVKLELGQELAVVRSLHKREYDGLRQRLKHSSARLVPVLGDTIHAGLCLLQEVYSRRRLPRALDGQADAFDD